MFSLDRAKIWLKSFIDHRLLLLLIPAALSLSSDLAVFKTLAYSVSAILFIVAISHWMRKVIMYFIDLEELLAKAKTEAMAASIVYLSTTLYMCVLVVCTVWWVRG